MREKIEKGWKGRKREGRDGKKVENTEGQEGQEERREWGVSEGKNRREEQNEDQINMVHSINIYLSLVSEKAEQDKDPN